MCCEFIINLFWKTKQLNDKKWIIIPYFLTRFAKPKALIERGSSHCFHAVRLNCHLSSLKALNAEGPHSSHLRVNIRNNYWWRSAPLHSYKDYRDSDYNRTPQFWLILAVRFAFVILFEVSPRFYHLCSMNVLCDIFP